MIKVIIIDDEEIIVRVLEQEINKQEDMQIIGTAFDGEEGFRLIKELNPDVVILDNMMPKLDGLGVLRKIRDESIKKPVIIYVSDITRTTFSQALELSVNYPMQKPADKDSLISTIRNYFYGSDIEKEKYNKKLESNITKELSEMGFNIANTGVRYLRQVIFLAYTEPVLIDKEFKTILNRAADKIGRIKGSSVRTAIQDNINSMWRYLPDHIKEYVWIKLEIKDKHKPKLKEVVSGIINVIKV